MDVFFAPGLIRRRIPLRRIREVRLVKPPGGPGSGAGNDVEAGRRTETELRQVTLRRPAVPLATSLRADRAQVSVQPVQRLLDQLGHLVRVRKVPGVFEHDMVLVLLRRAHQTKHRLLSAFQGE